jgi:signal transduction histidine kinase
MDYSAFFVPIVTLVTAQITVLDLARFRFSMKKMYVLLGASLLIQTLVSGSILYFLGYNGYVRWFFITMDLPCILLFLYTAKHRDMRDIFTIMIAIFINFAISLPSLWLTHFLDGYYNLYSLIRIIVFTIIFIPMHLFLRRQYLRLQDELKKGWGIFSILPMICLIFLYYQYMRFSVKGDNANMLLNSVSMSAIIGVVFWVLFYVFKQLHEKYLAQEQQRILTLQNKAQQDQFEQHEEMSEQMNRRWHDLRHSTQELIELLETGNTEAALSYLREQRGMEEVPKTDYCLHPEVNSILCLWVERSRKADIEVEIHTDVPKQLEIDPMELSALFANAFENAYDGCQRIKEGLPKYIKVESHYNGKRLAIGFMNSCIDDIRFENDMPVSAMNGGGIGTRSMKYTVQRFRGTVYFGVKDNVFAARFVLNI